MINIQTLLIFGYDLYADVLALLVVESLDHVGSLPRHMKRSFWAKIRKCGR